MLNYKQLISALIAQIEDKGLRDFVRKTLHDVYPYFWECPGGKQNHHNRVGGLAQHTYHVTMGALSLLSMYESTHKEIAKLVDKDLLIAGGLLHDIGKVGEYKLLENGTFDRTFAGSLMTHYQMGPAYIQEAWNKLGNPIKESTKDLLMMIAVTHHGIEFSQTNPSTISASLIHCADKSDAFADMYARLITKEGNEDGWVKKNRAVGGRVFDETRR